MQSAHTVVFGDPLKPVKLDDLRNVLIRQEETIIFALIERAQFPLNPEVYDKKSTSPAFGGLKGKYDNFDGSLLDFMFIETEKLHALTRRYTSPDENAFYPHLLPDPILPILDYPRILNPNRINYNDHIMNVYLDKILPGLTTPTSDASAYGSTATADIAVLQALSKRIHFGKFIAEAKFQAETERYTALIHANDAEGIMEALTNRAVENKVLERVKRKASTYGQDIADSSVTVSSDQLKVDPQLISDLYRDFVMPLTKEVEVDYLLQRVAHPAISVAGVPGSFCWQAARAHFGGDLLTDDFFVATESISKAFHDVSANRTAYAVAPIEDSNVGMIKETQALLLRTSLKVSAEIVLTRSFVFAARSASAAKAAGDVTTVFAAADTEARLLNTVELAWPTAKVVTVANVTEAAARAASEPAETGVVVAVTTASAASTHGLEKVDVSTTSASPERSFIRFAVISKGCPAATGKDKSCWSMAIKHEVGSLLSALEVWKNHGVNLTCLESIYRQDEGGYDFFVETIGHVDDANVRAALEQLRGGVCTVQHLGSFPIAKRQVLN